MRLTQVDDGACAVAPSDDVEQIGQRVFAAGGGPGFAVEAQAALLPLALALQLQRAVQGLQCQCGRFATLQQQAVCLLYTSPSPRD